MRWLIGESSLLAVAYTHVPRDTHQDHRATASAHSPGSSLSTESRARTSSCRFVSCVDSVVIVYGSVACIRSQ